jgi:hypothetical protein
MIFQRVMVLFSLPHAEFHFIPQTLLGPTTWHGRTPSWTRSVPWTHRYFLALGHTSSHRHKPLRACEIHQSLPTGSFPNSSRKSLGSWILSPAIFVLHWTLFFSSMEIEPRALYKPFYHCPHTLSPFVFFSGTGFWTQGSCLLGRCSTSWAPPPAPPPGLLLSLFKIHEY